MSSFKLPSNLKITTTFLHGTDRLVKKLFVDICDEYLKRYDLKLIKKKYRIAVSGVPIADDSDFVGATFESGKAVLVTVYDPALDQEEETISNHRYVRWKFVETLCHEFVHVMQTITGRKPEFTGMHPLSADPNELYFFDPYEIEARLLEDYYATTFGVKLREHNESE